MKFLFAVSFLLTLCSCQNKKTGLSDADKARVAQADCPPDLMCTRDFRSITVTVVDANNNPVILDSFNTKVAGTDRILLSTHSEPNFPPRENIYPVATDAHMNHVGKTGRQIEFHGFLKGKEVALHRLKIGHDCCHIKLLEGENKVVTKLY